ncbi:nucleotide-binding alpha-beta plait domain-containing protein [Tanacetum coccineum]
MLLAMSQTWLRTLTVNARGSPNNGGTMSDINPTRPVSFANLLNADCSHKKVHFRSFVNEEKVEDYDTVLPRYAIDKVKNKYENSLVGYFIGKSLVFLGWNKYLNRVPLILNKWTPTLPLKKDEVTKVHVWVKMHKVPLVAYSEDGLSLIATPIGKLLMLDAFTCSMCVESRGRISFSHVLVEISSDSELKREVTMAVPNEDDKCPKIVRKPETFVSPMDKQSDGFIEVTSKEYKGNKSMDHGKASTSSIKSIAHNTMANSFEVLTSLAGDDGVARMPSSSTGDQGVESDENEVYVSSIGGGQDTEEYDLDDYDGYEAQVYDLPEQMQSCCDQFDIRLKGRIRK